MYKKPSWPWNAFFLVYVFVVFNVSTLFFEENSAPQIYYQILVGFNSLFLVNYLLHVLAIIFDIIAIIPFYNYIKPESAILTSRYFSSWVWKWLLAIRVGLLVVGHSYDYKQLQSIYLDNYLITFIAASLSILLYAPSYYANFIIAYRQEKQ